MADCLVQLQNPDSRDVQEMSELVPQLVQASPDDRLVKSVEARWKLRQEILEKDSDQPS